MHTTEKSVCRPVAVHAWFEGKGAAWAYGTKEKPAWADSIFETLGAGHTRARGFVTIGRYRLAYVREPCGSDSTDPRPKSAVKVMELAMRNRLVPSWRPLVPLRRDKETALLERLASVQVPGAPGYQPELQISIPLEWLQRKWSTGSWLMVTTILVTVIVAVAAVLFRMRGTGIAREVSEKILSPLGVVVEAPSNPTLVHEKLLSLFTPVGMMRHVFRCEANHAGLCRSCIWRQEKLSREAASFLKATVQNARHPDERYVSEKKKDIDVLLNFYTALAGSRWCDRTAPVGMNRGDRKSLTPQGWRPLTRDSGSESAIVPWRETSHERHLRQDVERLARTLGWRAADESALDFLSKRVQTLKPWVDGQATFNGWMARELAGGLWQDASFPWDPAPDTRAHELSLLMTLCPHVDHQGGAKEREAAQLMLRWLNYAGVQGIDEYDLELRPWLTGVAFVEFLSLHHLRPPDIDQLRNTDTFVAQTLLALPKQVGWPRAQNLAENPWRPVRDRIWELCTRFQPDVGAGQDISHLVRFLIIHLANKLGDAEQEPHEPAKIQQRWHELKEELTELLRARDDLKRRFDKAAAEIETILADAQKPPEPETARKLYQRIRRASVEVKRELQANAARPGMAKEPSNKVREGVKQD